MLSRARVFVVLCLSVFLCAARGQTRRSTLDIASIPLPDWLNAGEHVEIPWELRFRDPFLNMEQLFEIAYYARIDEKVLTKDGLPHDLYLITRVSSEAGEWLAPANVSSYSIQSEAGPPAPPFPNIEPTTGLAATRGLRNARRVPALAYNVRFFVRPGTYVVWVVLFDRASGKHNVAKHRVRVDGVRHDPLPELYADTPRVQFGNVAAQGQQSNSGRDDLNLPVHNKRKVNVELVSILSPPDQWANSMGTVLAHNDDSVGVLRALSQLKLANGSLSIFGLDLVRRRVLFEQRDFKDVLWPNVRDAIHAAQSPTVSVDSLEASKQDGVFLRDFIAGRVNAPGSPDEPLKVIMIVGSSQLFSLGSDLRPLQIESDCRCSVYYFRFRLTVLDVLDEVVRLIKPLHPHTFDLLTAGDLRQAIGRIVQDLENLS